MTLFALPQLPHNSVGAYIDEGASAVVLSDAIFDKKAISQRNFSAIYQLNEAVKRSGDAMCITYTFWDTMKMESYFINARKLRLCGVQQWFCFHFCNDLIY
ncbi:hypothetical protein L1987_04433 [Smallanthus sonchifolius]|uniref:Uncharacterized protein n=1 Tax=Smallanthus sonchifolius TaxID=185202 RepID=A0ACB9KDF0_9ASTR|nr:hypothetical protein L1987_04433 [Smallanthus sonchifolius]